jgi:hypothetical protein
MEVRLVFLVTAPLNLRSFEEANKNQNLNRDPSLSAQQRLNRTRHQFLKFLRLEREREANKHNNAQNDLQ